MPAGAEFRESSLASRASAALALLLCLEAVVLGLKLSPWLSSDSPVYFDLASGLLRGHWGRLVDGTWYPEGVRPPGYPLFLAIFGGVVHLPRGAIVAVQLALALGSCFLLRRLAPARLRVWPMYLLVAAYPAVLAYSAMLASECLSTSVTAAFLFALGTAGRASPRRAAVVGALSGLGVLIRPNLVILPIIPVLVWAATREPEVPRFDPRRLGALALGFVIATSPMVAFNLAHFGKPTPLAVPGSVGTSLYLASWEDSASLADLKALYGHVATTGARESGLADAVSAVNRDIGVHPLTAPWSLEDYPPRVWVQASARIRRAAVERIREHPLPYLRRSVKAAWSLWCTTRGVERLGRAGAVVSMILGTLVWAGGLLGAGLSLRRDASLPHRTVGFLVLAVAVTQPWLHLEGRFTAHARLPLVLCCLWLVDHVLTRRAATANASSP